MDYLQMRDSAPLTEWDKKCIKRLKSLLTSSDSYTWIDIPDFDNVLDTLRWSDRRRMEWLSHKPQGIYIDTDCYIQKLFKPPTDQRCYFALNPKGGFIDVYYIFVNGNIKFIRDNFLPVYKKRDKYGWPSKKLIDITKKDIGIIPLRYYQHKFLTTNKFTNEQRRVRCQILL